MDLDILFKQRKPGHHNDHGYGGHQNVRHDYHRGIQQYIDVFEKMKSNKKLMMVLSLAAVVMLILVVAVIVMIIPPLIKGLEFIQTNWLNGLDGIIKAVRPLLELL